MVGRGAVRGGRRGNGPLPSQERTVPTAYGPTFVRISGPTSAPPIVLLPGAATPSLMWVPNIQALSAEYHTFAVDQIGDFGQSICTKPLRQYNDLLAWLNELLDALDLRGGVNLVGISFGGALAAEYALHFPGRLNKVVRRLKRVAFQGSAEIVPGARHDLTFVQAARVNQKILEFLKQERAASKMS